MLINIITGILTGFIVSIPPVGPIAFAIISKGFKNEIREGKAIAYGAAFMDFFYCLIAFGGINLIISLFPKTISEFYVDNNYIIKIVLTFAGCLVVILYGIKIMKSKISYSKLEEHESEKVNSAIDKVSKIKEKASVIVKHLKVPEIKKSNLFGLFFMGVMLCISSLTLPASWFALVGYMKGYAFLNSSFFGGLLFSVGAFIGTYTWFFLLMKLITGNKKKINPLTVNKLNIISGIVLLVLGVILFIKASYSFYYFLNT
ncbi:MAG: LysE family transporter [Ignavibacteria bacterium]|nr:LysE family transporter [Ignavibacteria bacterium]